MTENNKPSWQYTPPPSPTDAASIDATRYMKGGAPRRSPDAAATPLPQESNENSLESNQNIERQPDTLASEPSAPSSEQGETFERRRYERPNRDFSRHRPSERGPRGPRREGRRSGDYQTRPQAPREGFACEATPKAEAEKAKPCSCILNFFRKLFGLKKPARPQRNTRPYGRERSGERRFSNSSAPRGGRGGRSNYRRNRSSNYRRDGSSRPSEGSSES